MMGAFANVRYTASWADLTEYDDAEPLYLQPPQLVSDVQTEREAVTFIISVPCYNRFQALGEDENAVGLLYQTGNGFFLNSADLAPGCLGTYNRRSKKLKSYRHGRAESMPGISLENGPGEVIGSGLAPRCMRTCSRRSQVKPAQATIQTSGRMHTINECSSSAQGPAHEAWRSEPRAAKENAKSDTSTIGFVVERSAATAQPKEPAPHPSVYEPPRASNVEVKKHASHATRRNFMKTKGRRMCAKPLPSSEKLFLDMFDGASFSS